MKRLENNIYILDSNENLKESLRPQAFERKRQIGGSDVIQFETDQVIDKNDRLIWRDSRGQWHEYIVRGMDGEHDVRGVTKIYYAESSVYELYGDWIGNLWTNVDDSTALDALTRVLTGTEHGQRRTRWDVGNVPATVAKELNFKETTAYDALKTICETFDLELETEVIVSGNKIIKRNIHLTEQRGADYGKRFTWRKDLTSVERRVIQEDVITALKGYGKPDMIWDGHPVRLTFDTVNPTGLDYVYSDESRDRWGRLNADGTRSHFYGAVEFNDITDPWELLEKTQEHFEKVSVPQVEYEAQVEDMTRAGWDHEGVDLGDLVLVIDEELDVRIKARVMELTQDVEGYATKILIGNFRESWTRAQAQTTKAVSAWRSKVGVWDRASSINPDGTVNADIVEGIKDSWEQDMNAGLFVGSIETMPGGFRFINEDQSWATEIGVMGIRIADTKLPNGEWNWSLLMTGKGLAADTIHGDSIIGGTITSDHITAGGIDAKKITVSSGTTLSDKLTETDALQAELAQAVQGGGRNLIRNTSSDWVDLHMPEGSWLKDFGTGYELEVGETYTFSVTVEKMSEDTVPINLHIGVGDSSGRNYLRDIAAWRRNRMPFGERVSVTHTVTESNFGANDYRHFAWRLRNEQRETVIRYKEPKLEFGTLPTAYTRAPEDIEAEIAVAQARAEEAVTYYTEIVEGKVILGQVQDVHDRVETTEASIAMVEGALETRVTTDLLQDQMVAIDNAIQGKANASDVSDILATQSIMQQTQTDWGVTISQLSAEQQGHAVTLQDVRNYMRFSTEGLEVGHSDSTLSIQITNEAINFIDGGEVVAYITGQTLYINSVTVLSVLQAGNHVTSSYGTNGDITVERWANG